MNQVSSRAWRGIFFADRAKTARLFKHNSPTYQTKQPDYIDQTARLYRPNSPTI